MKAGFFQFEVLHKDKDKNLKKVAERLMEEDFDFIVLPELFTCGYYFDTKDEIRSFAEVIPDGETTQLLIKIAKKKNAFIVGGLAEISKNTFYNTVVVVGPNGYIGKHRKVHLPNLEKRIFTPGHSFEIFNCGNTKIGIITCFDYTFPEASRILALKGAQILCNPSSSGNMRSHILQTRAYENKVYVITANRLGIERTEFCKTTFTGESQIINYNGAVLNYVKNDESVGVCEIIPEEARKKNIIGDNDIFEEIAIYKSGLKDENDADNKSVSADK